MKAIRDFYKELFSLETLITTAVITAGMVVGTQI